MFLTSNHPRRKGFHCGKEEGFQFIQGTRYGKGDGLFGLNRDVRQMDGHGGFLVLQTKQVRIQFCLGAVAGDVIKGQAGQVQARGLDLFQHGLIGKHTVDPPTDHKAFTKDGDIALHHDFGDIVFPVRLLNQPVEFTPELIAPQRQLTLQVAALVNELYNLFYTDGNHTTIVSNKKKP